MTSQEQSLINGLIDRVRNTQLPEKDSDAERLLQQGLAGNPDSLYILAQTVLVQGFALEQSQKQLADSKNELQRMQQQVQQPAAEKHTSFLGSLFGSNHENSAPPPPPQAPPSPGGGYAAVPAYAPVQGAGYAPAQASVPGYAPPGYGGQPQGGGFLRGAAQTAAGVAAGALAFQGVESLLHGFGGGMGSALGGFGNQGGRPEEIINNNYYGDDARSRDTGSSDFADRRDNSSGSDPGDNIFTDGDTSKFAGTSSFDDGDSSSFGDSTDGSGSDDFTDSGFDGSGDGDSGDDGGGYDDGGGDAGGDTSF